MNKAVYYGRLVRDPEVRYSGNTQKAVVSFSIAVNREYKNKEGKYDTDFFNCIAFDKRGEVIGNSFGKGNHILVWGAMRQDRWQDKEGNNRETYRLYVEGFDFIDAPSSSVKDKATKAAQSVSNAFDGLGVDVDFY